MLPKTTDFSLVELTDFIRPLGEPDYRARQIFRWVYRNLAVSFDQMTDLPAPFRQTLAARARLVSLEPGNSLASQDGRTVKLLFQLEDGKSIESVLMLAEESGESRPRNTVCVSSQVGCQIRCPFCATGQQGFERNLSPGEIVEQVLYFQRRLAEGEFSSVIGDPAWARITNVVFMGMGEPLANYNAVTQAVQTLMAKEGFGLGARRITVSTCGLAPEIRRLAGEAFHVELAVSLHAANNELRSKLVPINRKYPIEDLMSAVKEFFRKTARRPTFEYILFHNINDSVVQAGELAALLRGMNCHVNLIAASPTESSRFVAPSPKQVRAFQDELTRAGIANTLRYSRGLDIAAACGQLRSQAEKTE